MSAGLAALAAASTRTTRGCEINRVRAAPAAALRRTRDVLRISTNLFAIVCPPPARTEGRPSLRDILGGGEAGQRLRDVLAGGRTKKARKRSGAAVGPP